MLAAPPALCWLSLLAADAAVSSLSLVLESRFFGGGGAGLLARFGAGAVGLGGRNEKSVEGRVGVSSFLLGATSDLC